MPDATRQAQARAEAVVAYKAQLRELLDRRPSGTRQRLADALGKNRSFISQICNPGYDVPVPAQHLAVIFDICHFSPAERESFLNHYLIAHPRKPVSVTSGPRLRQLHLHVPDLGSTEKNAAFDALIVEIARRIATIGGNKPKSN
jgi:hypothetical protein